MNHVAVDVGEASLEPVVIKGQPLVVEAKQVQDRGVQIVDGGDVLLRLPAKQIRCTECVTSLDASAGKPSGEAVGIVVAAAGPFLKSGHAAKLGAPDDQRILEQAALFQVAQQGRSGLV